MSLPLTMAALRHRILQHPVAARLMPNRCYPVAAPQGAPLPHGILGGLERPEHHLGGLGGLSRGEMAVDIYGADFATVSELADAVAWQLDGFRGTVVLGDGRRVELRRCDVASVEFGTAPPLTGQGLPIHSASMIIDVATTEPIPAR